MKASFVIIEYHSVNEILECVATIENLNFKFDYEIIVSSNSVYEEKYKQDLLSNYKNIKWLFNEFNNGFAYGMNRGIQKSSGNFIILQNPDTKIIDGDLKEVFNFMTKNNVGVLGPRIVNIQNEVQDSCRDFLTPLHLLRRLYDRYINGKQTILNPVFDYNKIQTIDWVIGGFMIIPRTTIQKIGVLSEDYFMYVEDMDYCYKAWKNNLTVYYYPELIVNYQGDRKSAGNGLFNLNSYTRIHIKNYYIFLKKYYNLNF